MGKYSWAQASWKHGKRKYLSSWYFHGHTRYYIISHQNSLIQVCWSIRIRCVPKWKLLGDFLNLEKLSSKIKFYSLYPEEDNAKLSSDGSRFIAQQQGQRQRQKPHSVLFHFCPALRPKVLLTFSGCMRPEKGPHLYSYLIDRNLSQTATIWVGFSFFLNCLYSFLIGPEAKDLAKSWNIWALIICIVWLHWR